MRKYICLICGYVYDESAEKEKFEDLPTDFTCPLCGAAKEQFEKKEENRAAHKANESAKSENKNKKQGNENSAMSVSDDIRFIGVIDREIDLFEGQYAVPNGMSYNSYMIDDEKTAVLDTVDAHFLHEWLDNLQNELNGRTPDYLIVSHMEPDHSANIAHFMKIYKNTTVISTSKSFAMMQQFFGNDYADRRLVVEDGDTLSLGRHLLTFVTAPMVHWPEVMVTYDSTDKVLFSADGFGKFGIPNKNEPWDDEARRYYIGIVGKYGVQVQSLLKKVAVLDIRTICPLHGPVLSENLRHYLGLYRTWSSYTAESEGIVIAYTSVYGNTKRAVEQLAEKLAVTGCPKVICTDLARDDMSKAVENAFRYSKLVLATTTYNADIFPFMRTFIEHLTERNYQNRTVAVIENGSWAPQAAKIILGMLEKSKNLTFTSPVVSIRSALNKESNRQLEELAAELCRDYTNKCPDKANKNDMSALFDIGYGLYVVTSNDGIKDNGLIVNTVMQVTNTPNRVAVTINKENYSHHVIKNTGKMNVCCLSIAAPFSIFKTFGFVSGRNTNKFKSLNPLYADNGLVFLPEYINSFLSLRVEQYVDFGTHGMFICSVTESRVINDMETMTYTYYQKNVKPKSQTEGKKGYVCKVCGYVFEGEQLPQDIICPICKHGAADFEPIR